MSSPSRTPQAGAPGAAVLLTWFVPGAGHLYLGRPLFALVAFAVVEGLYLLGLDLSGGMGFEFLQEELRGPFTPALAPETGNLGGFLWQMREYGFGMRFPRAFPETMGLGVALTSASGVLNACLMVQANLDARRPRTERPSLRSPALAVLLAWLVPGLGHLVQGRRLRGAMVFLMLVGMLTLGTALAHGANLSREMHFFYWGGQFMAGLPAMVLEGLHGDQRVQSFIPYAEAGLVIASVGGMLNVMAMLDVFGYSEDRLATSASGTRATAEMEVTA
ncbi:MAG: hypothetical protein QGI46_08260 [Planctomycetota bacterium]|jgi:hypothetical protein|nr:hypothetical protein [Planctomycetota bacterium]